MAFQTIFHKKSGKGGAAPGGQRDWYLLDLSATVYPTLQRRNFSSVYRLSVLLKEPIRPDVLQKAVDIALKRFPTYRWPSIRGCSGAIWSRTPAPVPSYSRISPIPACPCISRPGTGICCASTTMTAGSPWSAITASGTAPAACACCRPSQRCTCACSGRKFQTAILCSMSMKKPDPEELEDAYMRYANAQVCPPRPAEKTYRVRGTPEPFHTFNIIDGIMSVKEVNAAAKKYGATITEYLNSVLLYALLNKQLQDPHIRLYPVRIALPVNLRRFFPSRTLRNFITMVYPSIDPRLGNYTFEEIVTEVRNFMRYYINEKFLRGDITTNAATKRNPFIRIVPLFIKDIVVRTFYRRVQDKNSSAGLTNMGALKVPEDMKPYIERFDIYMGQPFSSRTNCAIVSFEDTLTVNFASCIIEADVERLFFRKLVEDGIQVKIESNRTFHEE